MAIDGVPWFPGQTGARVSAHMARTLAYLAAGAEDGVGGATDMKVQAQSTPGASVVVLPGAVASMVRASGHGQQSFIGRNATSTTVPVAATSGSSRTDLIAAIMRDPTIPGSGGTVPSDPTVGPYWEITVVSGVPANTERLQDVSGYATITGTALARITRPASTSTVTNAHITDLRRLSSAKSQTLAFSANGEGAGRVDGAYVSPNPLSSSTFVRWPHRAEWDLYVPAWATKATLTATVFGASTRIGDFWGELRAVLGSDDSLVTPWTGFDYNWSGNPERLSLGAAGTLSIPSAMRGTQQQVKIHGRKAGGPGHMTSHEGCACIMQVFFEESIA